MSRATALARFLWPVDRATSLAARALLIHTSGATFLSQLSRVPALIDSSSSNAFIDISFSSEDIAVEGTNQILNVNGLSVDACAVVPNVACARLVRIRLNVYLRGSRKWYRRLWFHCCSKNV